MVLLLIWDREVYQVALGAYHANKSLPASDYRWPDHLSEPRLTNTKTTAPMRMKTGMPISKIPKN